MDDDLVKLLANPFEEDRLQARAMLAGRAQDLGEGETHDFLRDLRAFRGSPDTVLYTHRSSAETVHLALGKAPRRAL